MKDWSNLAKIVYKRTYSRVKDDSTFESWEDTVDRVIRGNVEGYEEFLEDNEIERLKYFMLNRKAMPAGRGLWFSGTEAQKELGGVGINNCYFLTANDYNVFPIAQDYLMLGGGVGLSVEHRYVSKLPRIKRNVEVVNKETTDADFIVPDSREGWVELTRRVLEAYFDTGKGFSYSCVLVRGQGEPIKGFGGKASGKLPLIKYITKLTSLFASREGRAIRPIDAADIICCIGEMVVSGNVRRSALLIQGDCWDKEYLKAKRWDLGNIPTQRAMANFSIVCDDIEDVHPAFWKTYKDGEPFGIVNIKNIQKYGRMGEAKPDSAKGVNPCKPLRSVILTDNGYITYKQALEQDSLTVIIGGKKYKATKPFKTGESRDVTRITLANGSYLYGTEDHLHQNSKGIWKRVDELTVGDRLKYDNSKVYDISSVNTNSDRYNAGLVCGWVHGDGWFSNRTDNVGHEVGMSFGVNEFDVVSQFERLLSVEAQPHPQKPEICKIFRTHRTDIATMLLNEGVTTDKTDISWLYGKDAEFKIGFIKALFTADGSVRRPGLVELYSVRREALEVVSNVLREFGIYNNITTHANAKSYTAKDGKVRNNATCYKIGISQGQYKNIGFISQFKNDLLSKHEIKPVIRNATSLRVVKIEPGFLQEDVYDITVDNPDHSYLDVGIVTHNCAEATLDPYEACNLQEIFLPNLNDEDEFIEAARLMHRWGKRVSDAHYHVEQTDVIVKKNRRIGTGITGCLQSPLFNKKTLEKVYKVIQKENKAYATTLSIPESIRTTVVKPSGTVSLLGDVTPGIHPAYSRYYIRRVRFSANDRLISILKDAGHPIEFVKRLDGTYDRDTVVANFYCQTPEDTAVADENWTTEQQLDTLLFAQKYWADMAVSVTVYYKKDEIDNVKKWLKDNLQNIKTISFLCHNDHGFEQAPNEAITEAEYLEMTAKIQPINFAEITDGEMDSLECEGGACPIK